MRKTQGGDRPSRIKSATGGGEKAMGCGKMTQQDYLSALHECGGFYETPVDSSGKPLGPLVGYSGRYRDEATGRELQYVGTRYFNLAKLEQMPEWLDRFAQALSELVEKKLESVDYVVGVPEGGLIIGHNTAYYLTVMYAGLQKKIVALATVMSKEKTELVLGRHDIEPGSEVVLCEDLVNNYSTTDKAIAVVEAAGARVKGIICGLNRSERTEYNDLPVISVVHLPTPQYRQDDPLVAPYLENPGVVYDVKPNWARLKQAMAEYPG